MQKSLKGKVMQTYPNQPTFPSDSFSRDQADLLTAFYLDRFQRLLDLWPMGAGLSESEATSLVRHAIFSTYQDLRGLGREPEARLLLAASRHHRSRRRRELSPKTRRDGRAAQSVR
jgi:hypothetical protein